MKRSKMILCAVFVAGTASGAFAENTADKMPPREKAQAILEEVKQRRLESQIALKKTELQRLEEDAKRRQEEADTLQRSIDAIAKTLGESNASLETLTEQKKRFTQFLELTNQRIEAEKQRLAGLKTLSDAQSQAKALTLQQIEETSTQGGIATAELKMLSDRQAILEGEEPKEDQGKLLAEIADLKKRLTKAERGSMQANKLARETMSSANEKLLLADQADTRAKKTATDYGFDMSATGILDERLESIASGPEEPEEEHPAPAETPAPAEQPAPPKATLVKPAR